MNAIWIVLPILTLLMFELGLTLQTEEMCIRDRAKGTDTTIGVVEGMQFDRGYLSAYFVTNTEKMAVSYTHLSYNHAQAEDALRSAAYTYVVAALGSLATLIYYIRIFMGRRD